MSLHKQVLEYLTVHKLPVSADLRAALETAEPPKQQLADGTESAESTTQIERAARNFRRLTLLNTQLEQKIKDLEKQVVQLSDPLWRRGGGDGPKSSNSALLEHESTTAAAGRKHPAKCEPMMRLRGHRDAITSVALHPTDPETAISSSHDGTVRVWNLRTKKQRQLLTHSSSSALALASSSSSAGMSEGDSVTSLAIEPLEGSVFACVYAGDIALYEMQKQQDQQQQQKKWAGDDGAALDDSASGCCFALTRTLRVSSTSPTTSLSWCGDDQMTLMSLTRDGTVSSWAGAAGGTLRNRVQYLSSDQETSNGSSDAAAAKTFMCICTSPSCAFAAGCSDGNIFTSVGSPQHETTTIMRRILVSGAAIHTNAVTSLSFLSAEADSLLVAQYGTLERRAARRNLPSLSSSSSASPPRFLVSCSRDGTVALIDLFSASFSSSSVPSSFSGSTTTAAAKLDATVVWRLDGHEGSWINTLSLLPNCPTAVACGAEDDTVRILDIMKSQDDEEKERAGGSGRNREILRVGNVQQGNGVSCCSFSATVSNLASVMCCGGPDKTLSLWKLSG